MRRGRSNPAAPPYRVTRLPNGLRVATAEMPHWSSVSIGLWVGVGGRFEPARLNGVSHFLEHLLFKGTRKRSAREISQAVEGLGGYLNAFTSEEHTCYYSKARHDAFAELWDVLSDMFLNARLDPADIEKERDVIKEELAMYLDQPQQLVQELLNQIQWPDHPLGRPLTGSAASLDGLKRADLVGFLRAHYVAPCALVAAAGNLSSRAVVAAVAARARRFPPGAQPRFTPAPCEQTRPVIRLHPKATEQTQLALGIRTCSRHDERRYTLRLLNTLLGENMSSRLFQLIREDHGLAYNIYSSLSFFEDTGDLVVSAGLETRHLPRVLKMIVSELRRLAEHAVGPAELRRARDYVLGQMDLSLENTENQMMWLGEQVLGYGRVLSPAEVKRRLAEVRARDIRAVAAEFFRPDRLNLALVGPLKRPGGLAAILGRVSR